VLGGARSGKSAVAEGLAAGRDPGGRDPGGRDRGGTVEYVAAGTPPDDRDPEWAARVAAHRARRPAHWPTTETLDLAGVLAADDREPVLIDCLSLWLARVMDEVGAWDDDGAAPDEAAAPGAAAEAALAARVDGLLAAWRATTRDVVAVSNEVGCGVVPATASGRRYRDALGRLNALVAADSDQVWFCTAGLPQRLK
jgi:adenosylcobinamide kinase/adenosylcobinamide-phosphate guanylyltransferase